jgi:hypothetical protein
MKNKALIDEKIARLVQSVSTPIPESVEQRIVERLTTLPAGRRRILGRPDFWALVSACAALILAFFLLIPAFQRQPKSVIPEIRTYFELPDKKITIIFIQRPDFKLFEED